MRWERGPYACKPYQANNPGTQYKERDEETREEAKGAGAGFYCSCKANSDTRDAHHT